MTNTTTTLEDEASNEGSFMVETLYSMAVRIIGEAQEIGTQISVSTLRNNLIVMYGDVSAVNPRDFDNATKMIQSRNFSNLIN